MKTFGDRLRKVMEEKDVTAAELAARTGISRATISRYLSGAFVPKQQRTYALAVALNVDPAYLIFGDGDEPEQPPTESDPELQAIMDNLKNNPLVGQLNRNALGASNDDLRKTLDFLNFLKTQNKGTKKEDD